MNQSEFNQLVTLASKCADLPEALTLLQECEFEEVSEVALSLKGQFALAEVEGEQRVYHVTTEQNGDDLEEFLEHIMNVDEHVIRFVAWFFDAYFDVKPSDTYKIAGKTYQQPKRK
ncbi:hypothetical protein A9264_14590 [Vibrio sp. UCD-FRSSP16_10]|uniref:hypothetical protein n=1 Tax=unclassified Vibrio TaxID=2614977 RepID=UPI0007FBFF13|nr:MULTISPECIES: hypothetical protein [unclassified Vibrio]OBT09466.1 hypothetical protein A9260_06475 [Vibrio sp. UCD-FRSSP16_30]OBT19508.1 hypothetical protein A9264_14590 [Vibrio sp. UCD-FRSSP16_10]